MESGTDNERTGDNMYENEALGLSGQRVLSSSPISFTS